MSIWCTILDFDADDHDLPCARWVPCAEDEAKQAGHWSHGNTEDGTDRWYHYAPDRPCTCAAGPLAYQQSHVVPRPDHPRSGVFDLASVASHIGPDHEYRDDPDETHLPYLRVGLRGSPDEPDVVVLDKAQVGQLRDRLSWFLDNCDPEESL